MGVARLRSKLASKTRVSQTAARMLLVAGIVAGSAATVEAISVDRVDAVWGVTGEVGESSQVIPIRAAHPHCPSWSTLGGLVVRSIETDESVTITASFPEQGSEVRCEWMGNAMRATVKLDRPLGDRTVIDGRTGQDPATPFSIAFHTGQSPDRSSRGE